MFKSSDAIRLWMTAGLLAGGFILLQTRTHGEPIVPRDPLRELPYKLSLWDGREQPMEDQIVQALGVTDYLSRIYLDAAQNTVQIYVGYYASQRTGDTIHSPKNCLPGAGWEPIHSGYITLTVPGGRPIEVNEYVIQRDQNKAVVFYWYQGRSRVIASEYKAKFWMVADAMSQNRTDSALVRLVTPMDDGEQNARSRLIAFTQAFFPKIDQLLPQ